MQTNITWLLQYWLISRSVISGDWKQMRTLFRGILFFLSNQNCIRLSCNFSNETQNINHK